MIPSGWRRWFVYLLVTLVGGLSCLGQPDNDAFQNRIALQGSSISLEAYLLDASQESGEPNHAPGGQITAKSAWWTWRAPYSGHAAALPQSASFCDQGVAFYTGSSLAGLTRIDEVAPGVVPVLADVEYHLAVWSQCPPTMPDVARFSVQSVGGQGTDLFPGGGSFSGNWGRWAQTIGFSGPEPNEPVHAGEGLGPSGWWNWAPDEDGLATVVLQGHGFAPVLSAYVCVCQHGVNLPELVPVSHRLTDEIWVWPARKGWGYFIAVAGTEPGSTGVYRIQAALSQVTIASPAPDAILQSPDSLPVRLAGTSVGDSATVWWRSSQGVEASVTGLASEPLVLPAPPRGLVSVFALVRSGDLTFATPTVTVRVERPGDSMQTPLTVTGARFDATGDLGGATVEAGEPDVGGDRPASIWWQWEAPADGTAYVEVSGAPQFSAYQVAADGTLSEVALRPVPDFPGIRQAAVALGVSYRFRAADPFGVARDVSFRLRIIGLPLNGARTNAIPLPAESGSLSGNNFFATTEVGEPFDWLGKSIWYRVVSTADTVWSYELEYTAKPGSFQYPKITLFRLLPDGSLGIGEDLITFKRGLVSLDAGGQYLLTINGPASWPMDDFTFHWNPGESAANDRSAAAFDLTGRPVQFSGDLQFATLNANESSAGLWWRWRAPRSGTATLVFSGTLQNLHDLSVLVFRSPLETNSSPVNFWNTFENEGKLNWLPHGRFGTWFSIEAGAEYVILVQSRFGAAGLPFQAQMDMTSARVKLTGTNSPFSVELDDFNPLIESTTTGVGYGRGGGILAGAGSPPFQGNVPLPGVNRFSVLAYLIRLFTSIM